eukprot:TRINITY_DN22176_c0_g1_i1.p2 TRINITY_DN22176_c0_g1~~TRINITY_DN22176_c0_g1_i1.p2  ORF type:complete len:108 (-),score=32.62 TRINITY_DN22176_c0_g1_i1:5-328(-)
MQAKILTVQAACRSFLSRQKIQNPRLAKRLAGIRAKLVLACRNYSVADSMGNRTTKALEILLQERQINRLIHALSNLCLLYTSDAADEEDSVDLGGRRIIDKKKESG